ASPRPRRSTSFATPARTGRGATARGTPWARPRRAGTCASSMCPMKGRRAYSSLRPTNCEVGRSRRTDGDSGGDGDESTEVPRGLGRRAGPAPDRPLRVAVGGGASRGGRGGRGGAGGAGGRNGPRGIATRQP